MTIGSSYAKTEGALVGINYVLTHARYKEIVEYNNSVTPGANRIKPYYYNMHGASLDLKYAANMNNFFIAPGIFYEQNSFGGEESGSKKRNPRDPSSIQVQHRFGAKVDIGYDINSFSGGGRDISPYLTLGYATLKYKAKEEIPGILGGNILKTTHQDYAQNWFFGAGLKVNIIDNLSANIEYNWQQVDLDIEIPDRHKRIYDDLRYKTDLHIIKAGIILQF